jgi:hypothetical protein
MGIEDGEIAECPLLLKRKQLLKKHKIHYNFIYDMIEISNLFVVSDDISLSSSFRLLGIIASQLLIPFDHSDSILAPCRSSMGLERVVFEFPVEVILASNSGFNKDHRGYDHALVELDWHKKWVLGRRWTLRDLVDGVYRLKSHKWDWNYELFTGDVTMEIEGDGTLAMMLDFNHGS